MSTPVAGGHETATRGQPTRPPDPLGWAPRRPMASPVQAAEAVRAASETSNSPRSPPPVSPTHSSTTRPTHIYTSGPTPAGPTSPTSVRAPNPAKRVPNNPADELHSAVNRDALRKEAKKNAAQNNQVGVQRNTSAPLLPSIASLSPPTSPTIPSTTSSTAAPSAFTRVQDRPIMPRNSSIDSTISVTSAASITRANGPSAYRQSPESSAPQDVASLIAEAGSPEAAIQKLLADKNHQASHNAQLWRLVEKQRAMILGLNKDLEKALKEKEKYRKKLKEHLALTDSTTSLTAANQQLEEMAKREDSPSPVAVENASPPAVSLENRDISIDSRKVSDTSDGASFGLGRSDTPLDASNTPSSVLPGTPQSGGSANQLARDIELVEAASISAQENRTIAPTRTMSTRLNNSPNIPQGFDQAHKKSASISSVASTGQSPALFSTAKMAASRKAPPAPLNLSSQKGTESAAAAAAAARVTNNIIDPSDSEYEDGSGGDQPGFAARGRRKTREEDDRDRETVALHEAEQRSQSKKEKKSRSQQAPERKEGSKDLAAAEAGVSDGAAVTHEYPAQTILNHQSSAAAAMRQRILSDGPTPLPKSNTAPSLLSPGLPMSPRPGDRLPNSALPRAPNKILNSIPMSPRSGMGGLPLTPRAPRQPIPMPPQTPLSLASPHLARAEGYQTIPPPPPSVPAKELGPPPRYTPEHEKQSRSIDATTPISPGEIYQGLVTDQYPDLLLPPNALPSIIVKTASSRMKPSRQSYVASKNVDENPVFTLAVHERSSYRQLWRVEKTYASLAILDEQIKAACGFRERLPDKALFNGHAPAKIDARRVAIDSYFHRMLESMTDDKPAVVFCKFLSTDAIAAERGDYFGSVDLRSDTPLNKRPRREGYLTKRGKNFGGWKARYFVLDGPVFKYYDAEGGAQLGSIKLHNAQIGKQSNNLGQTPQDDEDNQFRHAFLVLEPKKKDSSSLVRHVLCAESDEERDSWVDALLQYVDYKEDSEDVPAKASLAAARPEFDSPRSPRLQKSLNDLRSPPPRELADPNSEVIRTVGYNDTVAGEAPVMGPNSKGGPPSPPNDDNFGPAVGPPADQASSGNPNISSPTNVQVISNAGDWGMKAPATPHNNKDKKWGLFSGFRGRSSSDLGPNDKVMSPGLPSQDNHAAGGVRAVFGAPLAEAVEYARPEDVTTDLPAVVYRCIEYLLARNALAEEGIFRLSGSNTVIKGLKDRFNTEGDVNLLADGKYYDIHAVASLLKLYLRELPSSILTRELHLEFLQCSEKQGKEKIMALNAMVHRLPRANHALLEALSSLLMSIVNNAEVNKMNVRNVGIVFAPTLNVPAPLISSFVEDQAAIFGPLLSQGEPVAPPQRAPAPVPAPTDLRSPRKQIFTDLPTPAYNQTTFQSLGVLHSDDTGMIPVHPTYATYQVAPQGEGGFGSLNDALKSPTLYNTVANGIPSSRDTKANRRESAMLGYGAGSGMHKTSMTQLREQLREDDDLDN